MIHYTPFLVQLSPITKGPINTYMMALFQNLVEWTVHLSATPYGALGLFCIAFAESSFFPIPPDILQIALSVISPEKSFWYASIALVGTVFGAMAGYAIGLYGGRPLVTKILSESRMHAVESYYQKYDVWAIAIAGFTPIPYKVFTISGGAFKIDFWRFVLVSILARGARFFVVATALFFFGEQIKGVILHHLNLVGIVFVVLLIGGFAAVSIFGKKHRREADRSGKSNADEPSRPNVDQSKSK